jgi:hypothetical protein
MSDHAKHKAERRGRLNLAIGRRAENRPTDLGNPIQLGEEAHDLARLGVLEEPPGLVAVGFRVAALSRRQEQEGDAREGQQYRSQGASPTSQASHEARV